MSAATTSIIDDSRASALADDPLLPRFDWHDHDPNLKPEDHSALARLDARLALLVEVPEREASCADRIPSDLSSRPPLSWSEQRRLAEANARWREEQAPTIAHRPVVTLFDSYGNERVIAQPLAEHERWQPTSLPAEREERWRKFLLQNAAAKAAATAAAAAEREADADKSSRPKRKARAPKLNETEDQRRAREGAVDRAKCTQRLAQQQLARVAGRLDKYSLIKKEIRADRAYLPFDEAFRNAKGEGTALRSELNIRGLQLYNARLPKGAAFGYDKRIVHDGSCLEPVFLRDEPYLVIGWWSVRGQLIVDLDGTWETLADLRTDIVRTIGVRLMPALIVYRLDKTGRIENPHLLWILPPGSEVGISGKSRTAPIRMFNMVQDALVAALLPIGADPGHENLAKTKNPLSPKFSVACTENFPTLQDCVAALPEVSIGRTEMKRRHRAMRQRAGEEICQSMFQWNTVKEIIKRTIAVAFHERDQEFIQALRQESGTGYGKWLREKVIPEVRQALGIPPEQEFGEPLRSILRKQIQWRCAHRPSPNTRTYHGSNRGRDREFYTSYAYRRHGLTGAVDATDRRAQGIARQCHAGTVTRRDQREATILRMTDQLGLFARIGGDVDDTAAVARFIIRSGKLSKSTVYARIAEVVGRFRDASRYIASVLPGKRSSSFLLAEQPATVVIAYPPAVDPAQLIFVVSHEHVDPPSSSQSIRGDRVMQHPESGVTIGWSTHAPLATTWLHWNGQRIDVESSSMLHPDHPTTQ